MFADLCTPTGKEGGVQQQRDSNVGQGLLGLMTPTSGTPYSDVSDSPMFFGNGQNRPSNCSQASDERGIFNQS